MPSNYSVTVEAINVPDRSLLPGANVDIQDSLDPGTTYTIDASIRMEEVPAFATTDHCQFLASGGALVVMEATTNTGSVTTRKCVTGPSDTTTNIQLDLTAPSEGGVTDTVSVEFYGAQSNELLAETTYFQIATRENTTETEGYDVFVDRVESPVGDLTPGDQSPNTASLDPGETFDISVPVVMENAPSVADEDHCDLLNGGASITLEVGLASGDRVTQTECVTGPQGETTTISVSHQAPGDSGVTDTVYVNLYGSSSKDPIAPTTYFDVSTSGTSPGDDFTFDVSQLEPSCSITPENITEGDTVEVDVNLEGFLPPGEESREIEISLLVDGEVLVRGSGFASVNGANGETFEITNLSPGEHTIGFELADLGPA